MSSQQSSQPHSWVTRFRASWTRWSLTRSRRRAEAQRIKWEKRLLPALLPVREAMVRLSNNQQLLVQALRELADRPLPEPLPPTVSPVQLELLHKETVGLLQEVLNSLQPPATEQLLQQLMQPQILQIPPTMSSDLDN